LDQLKNSNLSFIRKDSIVRFGVEKGAKIYDDASAMLTELIKNADFRNNKAVEKHMRKFILPEIAFYRAMQENGIEKDKAYEYIYEEIQKPAQKASKLFRIFTILPGFFSIARWIIKKMMTFGYPKEGWNTVWKKDDKRELSMDIHSCLYMETFSKYGCPELCKACCDTDVITLSGLQPKVIFVRTQTIGAGADYCNFRFLNGKKREIID